MNAYHQPTLLDEALNLVAKGAMPVAGATGIYSAKSMPEGELCDITRLGLGSITLENHRVVLGATVTLTQLADAKKIPGMEGALLRRVARCVCSRPMRNMITVGGNLAHQAYWEDMPVALMALDAHVVIQHAGKAPQTLSMVDCLKAGGRPWDGGLITEILVPLRRGTWGFGHERFARTANDYPMASVAVTLRRDGDTARDVRVVVGALAGRAQRLTDVEAVLEGKVADAALTEKAVEMLREKAHVVSNFRASTEYRRELAGTLARRAIHAATTWAMREEG